MKKISRCLNLLCTFILTLIVTGKYGKIVEEMVDVFFPEICISGFLDSKREGKFYTYDIYNPEDISN